MSGRSFWGTSRTSSTTTARRCLSNRRSQTNSHISTLTDILLDETSDINSDNKIILIVYPTDVFLGKEKKNGAYASVYPRNTISTFVGVSWGILSPFNHEKVYYANLFTKTG